MGKALTRTKAKASRCGVLPLRSRIEIRAHVNANAQREGKAKRRSRLPYPEGSELYVQRVPCIVQTLIINELIREENSAY
eukprot:3628937-Amphidinium_carterae.1